ncbi:MAG: AMP-binding protein, partial [Candidatus Binataceae bacterium]
AKAVLGEKSERLGRIEEQVDRFKENTDLARTLVEVYRPYIQELAYTFHGQSIRSLYESLRPADLARHPYQPHKIDWYDYWLNVNVPGLRRHIFPQLELHTRGRARPLPRFRNLLEMLDRAAERYGASIALVAHKQSGERTTTTYRELRDRVRRAALALLKRGVKHGDRVLLISENSPDWVVAYFAILSVGAIAVPLDHLIAADELAPICRIAEPSTALLSVAVRERFGRAIKAGAGKLLEIELSDLARPFVVGREVPELTSAERKATASIVFTSGTTGAPKGVMLSHGNFCAQIGMLARVFALGGDDVVLSLLPLHHTFEFTCGMLLPLASGATLVYPHSVDARTLGRTLADTRPTALIGVPAVWEAIHRRIVDEIESRGPFFSAAFDQLRDINRRLDRSSGINLGSTLFRSAHAALGGRLKLAVSGGAALSRRVAEFFNDIGIRLIEGYGLTEAAPVLSAAHPDEPVIAGSVGKPLSGVEVRLDGAAQGEVGEIVAHGPNVMSGYYRNPAATGEVLKDGWLHTGDLGRFDTDGRLFIVGRAKEVIVDSGGNNVYIEELEEAYGHSPYLKELAVVGMKVGQGEQVAALAVPAYARGESRRSVEDKLRAHFDKVATGLSAHKRIRILRFTDSELPRTRTRKVKRGEVAALIRRLLDADTAAAPSVTGDVEGWLAEALAQVASEPIEITPATRLIEDLGLDSLALAELGERIGERAGREIGAEEMANLRTVADLEQVARAANGSVRVKLPSYARFADPYTPQLPARLRNLARAALRRTQRTLFDRWLNPRILGRGNIPANRNVLVVANHASHLDFGLVAHALGRHGDGLVVLAAKDYFFNTRTRRILAANLTTMIPFDRERAQMESLDEAIAQLAAGKSVLMFPEGTRSPDGAVHEFKSGSGYLALRSGVDVLPMLISGTHDVLGKGALIPRRHPVEVRIGRVVTAADLQSIVENAEGAGAYRTVSDHLRNAVLALAGSPRTRHPALEAVVPSAPARGEPRRHSRAAAGNGRSRKHAKG